LLGCVARRDDDYRRSGRLEQRHDFQPVTVGQTQIEQHGVRLVDLRCRPSFSRACGFDHAVACARQSGAEQAPDCGLIVDDKYLRLLAHSLAGAVLG